ncbi:hypothetical protein [Streptomyces sp. NPDC017529]|uniref:hypothetical protein n=1 Tax=Streptomyces sp. NPDC017529 TaxID=3365000 RepID=UPI00378B5D09
MPATTTDPRIQALHARIRELEEQLVALHAENQRLRSENRDYERALGLNDSP